MAKKLIISRRYYIDVYFDKMMHNKLLKYISKRQLPKRVFHDNHFSFSIEYGGLILRTLKHAFPGN